MLCCSLAAAGTIAVSSSFRNDELRGWEWIVDRPADRIESIKTGGVSVALAGVVGSLMIGLNLWLAANTVLAPLSTPAELAHLGLTTHGLGSVGVLLSAALFGITYRYVVRTNKNPHLGPGAVGAFGLVRGCAQVETGWQLQSSLAPLILAAGESCLVFAAVAAGLDWCMRKGWIQPLSSEA
ncbi:MAG: hypothetical protein AAF268_01615 [Cyanobacteria bacterium P01_A01_bin.3]